MTQNESENKPQKLTLGSKLSLNSPINKATNVSSAKFNDSSESNLELKKSKLTLSLSLEKKLQDQEEFNKPINSLEVNKRLDILKKAAQVAKSNEDGVQYTSLSKLAEINQQNVEQISRLGTKNTENESLHKSSLKVNKTLPIKKSVEEIEDNEDQTSKKNTVDNKTSHNKTKLDDHRKLNKSSILHMLSEDEGTGHVKSRSFASIKRARAKAKRQLDQKQEKLYREVILPVSITVGELANRMSELGTDVVRELMKQGIMANINDVLDADTAEIITTSLGHRVKRILESDVENILSQETDDEKDLLLRPPVVTVMGHVDHGKTSLLDAIKSTDTVAKEAGGITQHIGAYKITLENNKTITFIDTPGHEAFTAMRTRGAAITDIVILVVAADDGIKPQTIEAINHAKAANVPIIVAINKIDKPDINIDKIKNELLSYGLISEELGGDVIMVPISATKKLNLDKLLEVILLTAEMLELKANFTSTAKGVVIESQINKAQGVITTILVKSGLLKLGDLVVAGTSFGRVRKINNDKGTNLQNASVSDPVTIYGLDEAPNAGDKVNVVQTEKQARDITDYRKRLIKDKKNAAVQDINLDDLFKKALDAKSIKELVLIIKADVQGSIEAIESSLSKIPDNEVKTKIIHSAVGDISESDVSLASATGAVIIGFNVKMNNNAASSNEKYKVDVRYYSIIYSLIDDIKVLVSGMLSPIIKEQHIGSAEIKQIFNITKSGKIAGSFVTKGVIKRGSKVKLYRDNHIIYEGKLKTLKRFKEDVKEVSENYECGIAFDGFEEINIGDKVEVFEIIEEKQKLL